MKEENGVEEYGRKEVGGSEISWHLDCPGRSPSNNWRDEKSLEEFLELKG